MKKEEENNLIEDWKTPEVNVLPISDFTEDVLSENFYNNMNS